MFEFLAAIAKGPFFKTWRSYFSRLKSTFWGIQMSLKSYIFQSKWTISLNFLFCSNIWAQLQKVPFLRRRGLTFQDWKVPFEVPIWLWKGTFFSQKVPIHWIFLFKKVPIFLKRDLFSLLKIMFHFFLNIPWRKLTFWYLLLWKGTFFRGGFSSGSPKRYHIISKERPVDTY